jgi:hypothetical protein
VLLAVWAWGVLDWWSKDVLLGSVNWAGLLLDAVCHRVWDCFGQRSIRGIIELRTSCGGRFGRENIVILVY